MALKPEYTAYLDLAYFRGDDLVETIEMVDYDLTGCAIAASVKKGTTKVNFTITNVDLSLGIFKIKIPRATMETMDGEWKFDVQITDTLDERLTRIAGTLYIESDVT